MTKKPLLSLLMVFLCISTAIAQQTKSDKGRLFLIQQRPRNAVLVSRESSSSLQSMFRTYDGSNNNVSNTERTKWGSAGSILFRELPAAYGSDPLNGMGGKNRPSPRKISNVLIDEPVTQFTDRELSTLVYQWGQFLDHDLGLTPTGTESAPIALPDDEFIFTEPIPFTRSDFTIANAFGTQVRQQYNVNTSWIDGSAVYGSDEKTALWLRSFKKGKLKTSKGDLMPYNTLTGEFDSPIDPNAPSMANDNGGTVKTFASGDVRAAENPVLTSIHTLFVREHNRICDRLVKEGLKNDEMIYQMARKEVGALIQVITYKEFLPALGVTLDGYSGYKPFKRPDIMNTFATASYRLGHTMVSDDVVIFDNNCEEVEPGEFDLVEVFWNPALVVEHGIDVFLKGAGTHDQYQTDTKINNVLRNFLFGNPSDPVRFGIDLGSLNIQRGRDHGLPDYNTARKFYTGRAARKFSDITRMDTVANDLKDLYGSVDNVDLWLGILAEDHIPGTSVGRTLHEMLRAQFEKLRDGDYYFYLNDPYLPSNVREKVRNTKFSDVIKRNTGLSNTVANVMHTEPCPGQEEEENFVRDSSKQKIILPEARTGARVYPNPAADLINIDLGSITGPSTIKIYSSSGTLVKTLTSSNLQKYLQVNVSNLKKGVYSIQLINAKETKSFTFVKM